MQRVCAKFLIQEFYDVVLYIRLVPYILY